jgi:hypothetical protein
MEKMTVIEFVKKEFQITKDGNIYCLDYDSPNLGVSINEYAKDFLTEKELAVFNALTEIDEDIFELDFIDCENIEGGFDVTYEYGGVVGKYKNETQMTKIFSDCLNKILDKYSEKTYLIKVMREYLGLTED